MAHSPENPSRQAPGRSQPGTTLAAELYFRHDSTLGEGPVWDDGVLYWTDIFGKAVYSKDDNAGFAVRHDIGIEVGAFAICANGGLILATSNGFQSFDPDTRRIEPRANPEQSLPENRFNDGKCDPRGRFVAGTMNQNGVPLRGALYLLDHDGSAREIFRPVSCSNGLAWSESGTTLFYIDTPTYAVRAFPMTLEAAD